MTITKTQIIIAAALLWASTGMAQPAESEDKWSFAVAPYLWVASVSAETTVPQFGPSTPNVEKFDTSISAGLMMEAQVRYGPVGVLVDFNWLQLKTESLDPGVLYSAVDLRSDYIYSTAALTYALPLHGKFHAEVLAGAAIWHVSTDLNVQSGLLPGFESSNSETWVNALIGANLRYDLTRHWALLVRGTVGGFTDSNLQYDVFAGVGYQFTAWFMATIGYRYLHEDHTSGDFTFDAEAQGGLLGVVFRF